MKMPHLSELVRMYSKHMGGDGEEGPDADIHRACEELVDLCEETIRLAKGLEPEEQLAFFMEKLEYAAGYSGWEPKKRTTIEG